MPQTEDFGRRVESTSDTGCNLLPVITVSFTAAAWDAAWVSPLTAGRTLRCGPKNGAKCSYCVSGVGFRNGDSIEVLICAAFLTNPGLAAIGCSYDCT